jgi:lipopolysaccharide/colanic/teichoic acid biosynthesis glycosyltransferase
MHLTESLDRSFVADPNLLSSAQLPSAGTAEVKSIIAGETTEEGYRFITDHVNLEERVFLTATVSPFNVDFLNHIGYQHVVNLMRLNDIPQLNDFFRSVNAKIPLGGLYINGVETFGTRKARILKILPAPLNWVHYAFDMVFTRVLPKLKSTKRLYYTLTKNQGRVFSRAEVLGRLYYCGFEVVSEKYINECLYFVARKIEKPQFNRDPHYGLIIKLRRVGKGGNIFNVYKLRTMHAYSEFLQKYVFDTMGTKNGDKANDDFRINSVGKVCRKFWIDELPMLINLFNGNIKIVGVRPLSSHKFNMYPKHAQEKRCLYKPGLIPPFYADLPNSFDELVESELKYIEAYSKRPLMTDLSYFFKAFKNIFFKGARSK